MNFIRSSIGLHSLQGIFALRKKAQLCNPCVRNELSPFSQEGHRARSVPSESERASRLFIWRIFLSAKPNLRNRLSTSSRAQKITMIFLKRLFMSQIPTGALDETRVGCRRQACAGICAKAPHRQFRGGGSSGASGDCAPFLIP